MSPQPPKLFDRRLYAQRRKRAAKNFAAHDFLHRRAMADIVDRLESVNRTFPKALFYGAGELVSLLTPACAVGEIVHADLTPSRLNNNGQRIIFDEDAAPFAPQSYNLIVSLLTLHNSNDLIGALAQMRAQLQPDGLLIAALFGEQTLGSLKSALYRAETALTGGVSARVPPFAAVRDLGACLQRAGFALPVADMDSVKVTYKNPARLFADLRGMGETSVLRQRANPMTRSLLTESLTELSNANGETQFDLIYLTGWAPHESQQKPMKPGSARASLEEAVKKGCL